MSTLTATKTLSIDGIEVPINDERNLLELIRKADIDLPTFCYHSELSVYGACRLCLVDVKGRGIQGACSTPPEPGMVVRTHTEEIREIRKITVELLLANHDQQCPTCPKNNNCQLQHLASRLGIDSVRFKPVHEPDPIDTSSWSLVRDPNKCVLCGDCVRFCSEIQGIGAIDFAFRGHQSTVLPAFNKPVGEGECVNCGQCASLCPTGALSLRSEVDAVWADLHNPVKTVVAQIAPAVRVAIGEAFGMEPGTISTGQIVAALRRLGFKIVYDTSFTADLTVIEEANEFLRRKATNQKIPQFTSCCPGWVKFAEQYLPDFLPNLSTCRSPQQMLGSLAKQILPAEMGVDRKNLVVVSIMPCTAKKFEAKRPEFAVEGNPDVDHVLTTQELAKMIREAGIRFANLEPDSFDMPMGFKTGAGVIFGNSGGVSEAVLRYAYEKVTGKKLASPDFHVVRGEESLRSTTIELDGAKLNLAVVHGLKQARELAQQIREGKAHYDLVEVMACPNGCIGGAGQPASAIPAETRRARTRGIYQADKNADLHKSQENHFVTECYRKHLGEVNGPRAHHLLHTHYQPRRRIADQMIALTSAVGDTPKVQCSVCVGTACFVKGSQAVLQTLVDHVEENALQDRVQVSASFCHEQCQQGPNITIGEVDLHKAAPQQAKQALEKQLSSKPPA